VSEQQAPVRDPSRAELGRRIRAEVVGDNAAVAASDAAAAFRQPLMDLALEYCWGTIWARPGLTRRERSLLNLGMLLALGRLAEFRLHVRGSLRNGCSVEEIQEVLLQASIYCGVAAGSEGFRLAYEAIAAAQTEGSTP
jgi:4-carboxymuconolactone decarboxylase